MSVIDRALLRAGIYSLQARDPRRKNYRASRLTALCWLLGSGLVVTLNSSCYVSRSGESGGKDRDAGMQTVTVADGREGPARGVRTPVPEVPGPGLLPGAPTSSEISPVAQTDTADANVEPRSASDAGAKPPVAPVVPPRSAGDAGARPNAPLFPPQTSGATDAHTRADAATAETNSDDPVVVPVGSGCGGAPALGMCWYLAEAGTTCRTHCARHGGFDARSARSIGTPAQGGDVSSCAAVFAALKVKGPIYPAFRADSVGLGCHRWSNGELFWVESPDDALFSQDSFAENAELTCACTR